MLSLRVENEIQGTGFESIAGFEVTAAVAAGFVKDRIEAPTEVQIAATTPILEGHHVVIQSGTGTGKTLAYLLPILQKLRQHDEARAVCITPSAELAVQVHRVAERYKEPGLSTAILVTGGNQRSPAGKLTKSTRLIVGTPARVLEMYAARKLKGVNTVVLDEPEPILTGRNVDYLYEVLSRPEPKLQLIFAGATFGSNSERWIAELMGDAVVRPQVSDDPLKTRISHHVVSVRHEGEKDLALARFIQQNHCKRAIVFVNQPNLIRHLYRFLTEQNLTPVTVSAERTKQQCKAALIEFNQAKARVLLTTDQVAAGLDISDLEWVLHYELPRSAKAYVHRAGRTGRAGKAGRSVVFACGADQLQLKRIERELGVTFQVNGRFR